MWVDASRLNSPCYPRPERSFFPDPISALIDAERREAFERDGFHYESDYALLVQYLPPLQRDSRIADLLYYDDGKSTQPLGDRHLADFTKRLDDLADGLGDNINLRRMTTVDARAPDGELYPSDELVNYLHFALTGDMVALRIPQVPMYLDASLGSRELWPADTPRLGDKFIAAVAIEGFPGSPHPTPSTCSTPFRCSIDGRTASSFWSNMRPSRTCRAHQA